MNLLLDYHFYYLLLPLSIPNTIQSDHCGIVNNIYNYLEYFFTFIISTTHSVIYTYTSSPQQPNQFPTTPPTV